MLKFMALYWPQGWKKDTIHLGGQFATLGAKQQAKNAQSWCQVFPALIPSVKRALDLSQKQTWTRCCCTTSDDQLMKKIKIDFVKIKLHSSENIE
jgi:hypothetical protein